MTFDEWAETQRINGGPHGFECVGIERMRQVWAAAAANFVPQHDRPIIHWRTDRPPAAEKVIYLTSWGVLNIGNVTTADYNSGFCVCWQKCPKKPGNWNELLVESAKREST